MISKSKVKAMTRKPPPAHAKYLAHSPSTTTFPNFGVASPVTAAIMTFEQEKSAPSQTHSITSVLSQIPRQQQHAIITIRDWPPRIPTPTHWTSRTRFRILPRYWATRSRRKSTAASKHDYKPTSEYSFFSTIHLPTRDSTTSTPTILLHHGSHNQDGILLNQSNDSHSTIHLLASSHLRKL
jgi:hypothetical protein